MRTFNDVSAIVCEAIIDKTLPRLCVEGVWPNSGALAVDFPNVVKANEYLSG